MSQEVFDRSIEVLKEIKQEMVGLNHYGESLLHHKLIPFCNQLMENGIKPFLYTNGDVLTDNLIKQVATIDWHVFVISGHMDEVERHVLYQKCLEVGVKNINIQETLTKENTLDLAGQLPHGGVFKDSLPIVDPQHHCKFLVDDNGVILWNGDVTVCCVDYDGLGIYGNIMDPNIISIEAPAFKLCDTCPGHPGNIV